MASRAATSIATRRHLQFLYRRLQASNFCYMTRDPEADKGSKKMRKPKAVKGKKMREKDYEKEALPPLCIDGKFRKRETEAGKIIKGAPPRSIDPYCEWKFHSRFLPRGYDAVPYVHLAMINTRKDLKFSPKSKPNPDVFIPYVDGDDRHYFAAHSVGEDGAIKPKYYIYAPYPLRGGSCDFSGANCNGVFHFHYLDARDHFLWNPLSNWVKTLPLSPEKMKGISRSDVLDCAMWCDDDQDNCKVLLVVEDNVDDIDLDPVFNESGELVGEYGDRSTFHLELYSSKTNSWSILDSSSSSIDFSIIPNFLPGTCLDGVYHCGAHSSQGEMCILLFDFANETTSTVPLTVGCSATDELRLVEYKGLPSVLISKLMEPIPSTYYHYVWDNGNWSYNYRLCTCGVQRPICFSRDGQVLYFESLNDELVMLNLTTGEIKPLGVYCSSKPIGLYGAS